MTCYFLKNKPSPPYYIAKNGNWMGATTMADYIPQSDDSLVTWLTNYKAKLGTHGAALGISAADILIHQNECDSLVAAIHFANQQKTALANANKVKADTRTDVVGNLRSVNNRIKTNSAYTEGIGADLGIISTSTAFDAANAKPILGVLLSGGKPVINFSKEKSNGVKIYSRRGSETTFTFLALDTHSPYHDNRNNLVEGAPETRSYYAFYIDNTDESFGLQSDTINIAV